jgi:peptide/nickel transport system substrate-binding protein
MNRLKNSLSVNKSTAFILCAFVPLWFILFSSCKNHKHPDKQIFRYNESSGLASLDPAFAKNKQVMWATHQLYNTLIEIDSNMQMQPSLATHWDIADDNLVFTFYLRNDVFFTDDACFTNGKGRQLTAYDVEFSFKRIVDKATASPGAWIFNNRVDSLNGFKAIDDTTFQLKLVSPFQSIRTRPAPLRRRRSSGRGKPVLGARGSVAEAPRSPRRAWSCATRLCARPALTWRSARSRAA